MAVDHIQPAHPDNHANGAHHQADGQGGQPGPLADPGAGNGKGIFHHSGKPFPVMGLVVEGLHGLDLGKVLPHIAAHIRHPVLTQSRQVPHPAAEKQNRHDHQRKAEDDNARQLGVGDEQQNDAANQHQRVAQGNGHGRADH